MSLEKGVIRARLRRRLKTTLRPFQRRGVYFFERHGGRVVCGDEMGLGKSVQSIAYAVLHRGARPVVVVCPAHLKYNWRNEWSKHAGIKAYVCDGDMTTADEDKLSLKKRVAEVKRLARRRGWTTAAVGRRLRSVRASVRKRTERCRSRRVAARAARVLVVNYDILESWLPTLLRLKPKILVFDECHYIKNRSAKRTKACRQLAAEVDRVLGLSGTPIAGKPVEFFSVLQMVRPEEFPSFWKYAFEFCGPKRNRWSGGWDFGGRSNLDALRRRLKTVMIRRLKKDVLKQLPEKTRTVLPVDIDNRVEYEEAEETFLGWLLKRKGRDAWDRARRAEAIVRMNALMLLAAQGKIGAAVRWLRDWLESTSEKIIVFAVNRVILDRLKKEFPGAPVVDGSVSSRPVWRRDAAGKRYQTSARQEEVDRFERDPKQRVFIGQLEAAGTGLNIVSANNVLFLQIDWVPGKHDQAEARPHRIGQTKKVSVYYMVAEGTIEERVLEINQEKDETVSRILDGKKTGVMRLLSMFSAVARKRSGK